MRTTALTCAAVLACLVAPPPAHAQEAAESPYATVDAYLAERLAANGVPGAAWAVVGPDEIEHTAAWGEDGDGEPVTETTPFLWGSVAKPVTATAVMTLVEDGAIVLDEPVTAYLPDFRLAEGDRSDRITVRHLLEQTSGIPEGSGITDHYGERDDPYGEAVAGLADTEPFAEPGTSFAYASANYLVLGAIVQAVSGRPYEQYLREAVLEPLGMDGAIATAEDAESMADGHAYVFGQTVPIDTRFDPTGASYGYLGGTVTDLARFAMAHLGDGAPVLEPASVERAHTGTAEASESSSYGLGWYVDPRNDDTGTSRIWHVGATPGYSASVIMLPEVDRALVMAQNAYGHFQNGPLVGTMLDAGGLLAGGEATERGGDWRYPSLLALLIALTAAAAAVVAVTLRRIRRGMRRPVPRWRTAVGMAAWAIGGLAVAYVAGVALPSVAPSRTVLLLIAPDVGWGLFTVAFAALAVVAVRVWAGVLRLRRGSFDDGATT